MLKSLDVLIGFSVIMLAVSMAVTLIIQWILHLLQLRSQELQRGLTTLLHQIDPERLTRDHTAKIVEEVLHHPLVARSGNRAAEIVRREELIQIVLELAGSGAAPRVMASAAAGAGDSRSAVAAQASTDARSPHIQALAKALEAAGISDPARTLDDIHLLSMKLEAARPEMAAHVREATAVITRAESQFVAKVNGWLDQTMERVGQRFANRSHFWTVAVALVVALALQLNSFRIVNRLAMDDELRATLVRQAEDFAQQPPPLATAPLATPPVSAGDKGQTELKKLTAERLQELRKLATEELISWPQTPAAWLAAWTWSNIPGILLSAMLISFGAPFWFKVLGNLLKLRSTLASNEEEQRRQRATAQTDSESAPPPAELLKSTG